MSLTLYNKNKVKGVSIVRTARTIGAIWGVGGITLLIIDAIYRLSLYAAEAFIVPFGIIEWSVLVIWCIFMFIAEGYRGFQKNFSPRVVARAQYIAKNGSILEIILAPFFCIGFFGAPMRRIIAMFALTVGIIALIVIIHFTAVQPWRGILDSGVVLGLSYGLVSMGVYTAKALRSKDYVFNPEIESVVID